MSSEIYYSEKYYDDKNEYRHVILPKAVAAKVPREKLLSEDQWRGIGVTMSAGWIHYAHHAPEPHILLFKRSLSHPNATGPPKATNDSSDTLKTLKGH